MQKLNNEKYRALITNCILVLLAVTVCAVGFLPQKISPIFGKGGAKPYYSGSPTANKVSLMFNVYEGAAEVNSILDILSETGVKATFFMGGTFAIKHESVVRRIALEGHELGNHGYFHRDHAKLTMADNLHEIRATESVVRDITGVSTRLFAPPSGSFSNVTLSAAEELGYLTVMWSKDTIDWRDSDPQKIFARATKNPKSGDLILMHPKAVTVSVLKGIIEFYRSAGFVLSPVSENLMG